VRGKNPEQNERNEKETRIERTHLVVFNPLANGVSLGESQAHDAKQESHHGEDCTVHDESIADDLGIIRLPGGRVIGTALKPTS